MPTSLISQTLLEDPVFNTYAICAVLLTLKMIAASFNVTRWRFKLKSFKYAEDYNKARPEQAEKPQPKEIQRAYGLHVNDMALLWTYTVARFGHSVAYLKAVQPWRAIFYMVNVIVVVTMSIHLLTHLFTL